MKTFSKITIFILAFSLTNKVAAINESPVLSVFSESASVDLTKKMRDEYTAYVNLCCTTYTEPVFKNSISHFIIIDQCPTILNMFKELSAKLEINMPQIMIFKGNELINKVDYFIGNCSTCNAISLQTSIQDVGQVIIGEDLLTHPTLALTYDEFKAIIAHELSHLKHQHGPKRRTYAIKIMATNVARLIATLGLMYKYSHDFYKYLDIPNCSYEISGKEYNHLNRYNLINYMILSGFNFISMLGNSLVINKFCRSQEKEADTTSVDVNKDAKALISGIEKMEKMMHKKKNLPNMISNKIVTAFRSHPLTIDREDYLDELGKNSSKAA